MAVSIMGIKLKNCRSEFEIQWKCKKEIADFNFSCNFYIVKVLFEQTIFLCIIVINKYSNQFIKHLHVPYF